MFSVNGFYDKGRSKSHMRLNSKSQHVLKTEVAGQLSEEKMWALEDEERLKINALSSFSPYERYRGNTTDLNISILCVLKDHQRDGPNVEGLSQISEAWIEEVIHICPGLNIACKMSGLGCQRPILYVALPEENGRKHLGILNADEENLLAYRTQYGNVFIKV